MRPACLLQFISLTLDLQYRGSTRSPGAWTTVARRISDELDELKRKILHERKMTQGEKQLVSVDGSSS